VEKLIAVDDEARACLALPREVSGGPDRSFSRRGFIQRAGAVAVAAGLVPDLSRAAARSSDSVPFYGKHQGGITTPQQSRLLFAVFDVDASAGAAELRSLLRGWSKAAENLCAGKPARRLGGTRTEAPGDTGEAFGLGPGRLTLTIGFGPSLFDGRFGLAPRRPAPLVDLPAFPGDQLDPQRTGGDLCIQACADGSQVVEHAIRNLARIGAGLVALRWQQHGFLARPHSGGTGRNMLGFKDGTNNLHSRSAAQMRASVWASRDSSPGWMLGGTYLVARRVRNFVEHWDSSSLDEQERSIGRKKGSGAPLGERHESDPVHRARLPADAHILLANPRHGTASERERLLRRGYNFADGVAPLTSNRRDEEGNPIEGVQDTGLMFLAFQQDPRRQFIPIQTRLAAQDALGEYLTHVGSGIFAIPPGMRGSRGYVGETLLG
jgi:deferrochelatase/peroxidase EfeB